MVASTIAGAKGLDKLGELGKGAGSVGAVDDVARAGETVELFNMNFH